MYSQDLFLLLLFSSGEFSCGTPQTMENAGDDEELLQEPWVVVGCWYRAEVSNLHHAFFLRILEYLVVFLTVLNGKNTYLIRGVVCPR